MPGCCVKDLCLIRGQTRGGPAAKRRKVAPSQGHPAVTVAAAAAASPAVPVAAPPAVTVAAAASTVTFTSEHGAGWELTIPESSYVILEKYTSLFHELKDLESNNNPIPLPETYDEDVFDQAIKLLVKADPILSSAASDKDVASTILQIVRYWEYPGVQDKPFRTEPDESKEEEEITYEPYGLDDVYSMDWHIYLLCMYDELCRGQLLLGRGSILHDVLLAKSADHCFPSTTEHLTLMRQVWEDVSVMGAPTQRSVFCKLASKFFANDEMEKYEKILKRLAGEDGFITPKSIIECDRVSRDLDVKAICMAIMRGASFLGKAMDNLFEGAIDRSKPYHPYRRTGLTEHLNEMANVSGFEDDDKLWRYKGYIDYFFEETGLGNMKVTDPKKRSTAVYILWACYHSGHYESDHLSSVSDNLNYRLFRRSLSDVHMWTKGWWLPKRLLL